MLAKEFQEEEERSKQFMSKLKEIKKVIIIKYNQASKQIKTKNIHSIQRSEWSKEYQQLLKAEKMLTDDHETKLLLLEIQSDLPKHYLSAINQENIHSYNNAKEELVYQLSNLKRVFQQFKNQLPSIKTAVKSVQPIQLNELVLQLKDYLEQMQDKLESEFIQEYEQVDEECEESLDMFQQNLIQLNNFHQLIQQEYENDKLMNYAQQAENDEIELIEEYEKALSLLIERYQLEIQSLAPKQRIQLNDQMLYLASSNSLHNMQRLILHYPKIPREQLQNIVDYIRKQKDINKRVQILKRNWKIELNQLQQKTESLLSEMSKDKIQKNQRWLNYLQLKQEKLKILEELEEKRIEYEKKQREQQEKEQQEQQQLDQIENEKQEEWLKHKAEIAQQTLQFKKEKDEKRLQFLQEQQMQLEIQKREQAEKLEQAKPNIQFRQKQQANKIIDQKIKQDNKRIESEYNKQRIEDAINKYSIRPQVECDFARVIQETETRQIRKQTKYDKADKIQLSNVTGFNINQLMSDMRYRLQVALGEAGLGQTKYANQVLNQMSRPNMQ